MDQFPAVVDLNVGGRHFTTHLSTLTKEPNSMLAAMFSGRHPCSKDKDGRFFIDVDGDIFCHILNYLRFNKLNRFPSGDIALMVYEQACYFHLQSLTSRLESCFPVRLETWLEKNRAAYPWYRDIIENCFEEFKVNVNILFLIDPPFPKRGLCPDCRQTTWRAVADDPRGEALEYLIRHELKIRNFDMSNVITTIRNCQGREQQKYRQCASQKLHIQIRF